SFEGGRPKEKVAFFHKKTYAFFFIVEADPFESYNIIRVSVLRLVNNAVRSFAKLLYLLIFVHEDGRRRKEGKMRDFQMSRVVSRNVNRRVRSSPPFMIIESTTPPCIFVIIVVGYNMIENYRENQYADRPI